MISTSPHIIIGYPVHSYVGQLKKHFRISFHRDEWSIDNRIEIAIFNCIENAIFILHLKKNMLIQKVLVPELQPYDSLLIFVAYFKG